MAVDKTHETAHLLLGREVVDDVEELPDFLGRLTLNHVGNGFASDIAMVGKTS